VQAGVGEEVSLEQQGDRALVPGARGKCDAHAVGLELGLLVQGAGNDFRAAADRAALLQVLEMELAHHVPDLVPEYTGKIRFACQQPVQALCDVDVAAGDGESVDIVRLNDAEMPRQIGPLAVAGGRWRFPPAGSSRPTALSVPPGQGARF
jgi:hypothetical protein